MTTQAIKLEPNRIATSTEKPEQCQRDNKK